MCISDVFYIAGFPLLVTSVYIACHFAMPDTILTMQKWVHKFLLDNLVNSAFPISYAPQGYEDIMMFYVYCFIIHRPTWKPYYTVLYYVRYVRYVLLHSKICNYYYSLHILSPARIIHYKNEKWLEKQIKFITTILISFFSYNIYRCWFRDELAVPMTSTPLTLVFLVRITKQWYKNKMLFQILKNIAK